MTMQSYATTRTETRAIDATAARLRRALRKQGLRVKPFRHSEAFERGARVPLVFPKTVEKGS
jgi:hypothetical protein